MIRARFVVAVAALLLSSAVLAADPPVEVEGGEPFPADMDEVGEGACNRAHGPCAPPAPEAARPRLGLVHAAHTATLGVYTRPVD